MVYYTHELNLNDGTMIFIGFEIMMYKFVGQILNSSLALMIAKMAKSTSTLNFQWINTRKKSVVAGQECYNKSKAHLFLK